MKTHNLGAKVWSGVSLFSISFATLVITTGIAPAQTTNTSAPSASSTSNPSNAVATSTQKSAPAKSSSTDLAPNLAPPPAKASPFQFDIGAPLWSSAISGTMGFKGYTAHAYVSFSDLWNHIDYVVPLTMDAHYQKWGFHLDGQYVKLSAPLDPRGVLYKSGDVTMEQAFANFNLNYKVVDTSRFSLNTSIGGRYNYLNLGGTLQGRYIQGDHHFHKGYQVPDQSADGNVEWVDPILGVTASVQICKPVSLQFLADVGGFGVGSHITYQFFAGPQVQIARNFYGNVGFRYLYTNYSEGGNVYNVDMSGPQMTFGVNF